MFKSKKLLAETPSCPFRPEYLLMVARMNEYKDENDWMKVRAKLGK